MCVYALDLRGFGAVIVDSVTNMPLPISIHVFADAEEGEQWLQWLGQDPRAMNPEVLAFRLQEWYARHGVRK